MSGKYQAYPEYKDSAVAGISTLPAHWAEVPLKHVATCNDEVLPENIDPDFEFHYIDIGSVSKTEGVTRTEKLKFSAAPSRARRVVKSGDVIVSTVRTYLEAIAPISHQHEGMVASTGFAVIRPTRLESTFAQYALRAQHFIDEVVARSTGVSYPAINASDLVCISTPVPPIQEQRTIAAFLDHETSRIDRLIEKQQRLIELLKEKRQAVISHAVTKGLDPNVPMKDSGVEWLGQVPEHWVIRRLKHTAQLQSGIPKGKDLSGKQTISVSMLRVANVQDGYVKLDDVHQIKIEPHELMRYSLQSGDVLMNEGGDNDKLGRGAVWHGQLEPCIHQNHVFAIRVSDIEPEWLSLVTGSKYAKYHFYCVAKQSTNLASISSSNIKETPLVIPPEIERQQIMEYLANMTSKLDQVSEFASKQIALLQERRTALISAAVTGKIDVRNCQPNTNTQAAKSDLPMAAEQAAEYRV